MTFIAHYGGDLKEGKAHEFQEWLNANEKDMANAHPEGAKYIGTFFSIYSSEKTGGTVHTFVEMDSYGTLDTLAEAGKPAAGVYSKLFNEFINFFDQKSGHWTNALYKSVTAATLVAED
jgi:hypothetical protein